MTKGEAVRKLGLRPMTASESGQVVAIDLSAGLLDRRFASIAEARLWVDGAQEWSLRGLRITAYQADGEPVPVADICEAWEST